MGWGLTFPQSPFPASLGDPHFPMSLHCCLGGPHLPQDPNTPPCPKCPPPGTQITPPAPNHAPPQSKSRPHPRSRPQISSSRLKFPPNTKSPLRPQIFPLVQAPNLPPPSTQIAPDPKHPTLTQILPQAPSSHIPRTQISHSRPKSPPKSPKSPPGPQSFPPPPGPKSPPQDPNLPPSPKSQIPPRTPIFLLLPDPHLPLWDPKSTPHGTPTSPSRFQHPPPSMSFSPLPAPSGRISPGGVAEW